MLFSKQDIKKLIIPLIIEQVLVITVGVVDTVMISSVGEAAVSGVSLVDTINILIINIFTALATGGAVVAGHFLGQKDNENAGKAAWQLMLFCLISSIAVMILFLMAHHVILGSVFGQITAEVMKNAKTYLIITAFSIVPLAIYNAGAALFRAMGNSKVTMWISLLMNVINITGNTILIFGFRMGVAGAAISTTVSRLIAAMIIFSMLFSSKRRINFRGKITIRFRMDMIKKILYIGVPNGLENSMFQLGKIILLSLVSTFGTYAITANAVANAVAMFNILPGVAINSAILSVASYCIGAGEYEQAKYYTKSMIKTMYLAIGVLSVAIAIFLQPLLSLYNLSPKTSALAEQVILYHAVLAVIIWAPSFAISNTLRAAGDVIYPMVTAGISMWVFRVGTAYLLADYLQFGLLGVWIAMTIDWLFRAICYVVRYRGGKWIKKRVQSCDSVK